MNTPAFRSNLSVYKKSALGWIEFQSLLDLLPDAVILADLREAIVVLANSKATELTAFTRSDLAGMSLTTLFPLAGKDFLRKPVGQNRVIELSLARHGGAKVIVRATLLPLETQGRWMLLALEPAAAHDLRQAEALRDEQLWGAAQRLASAPLLHDLDAALCQALQAGSELTGAPILAIYQADGEATILHRTTSFGRADSLPETLKPGDWFALQSPCLWLPGKRPTSDLHRSARIEGLSYVGSVSLGQANASIGLVAIAGEQTAPLVHALDALSALAAVLASIIQTRVNVKNLGWCVEQQRRTLTLHHGILESVLDGVIVVSESLNVLELNPAAEEIFGYATREVSGQPLESILVGVDTLLSALEEAKKHPVLQSLGNVTLYRRNGQAFLARIRIFPVEDERVGTILVFVEDLSQEEEFRIRTQQLEQRALLGEIMAVFAHEVRNPINNISTGLQLMGMNLPLEDANQETIHRLQQDCDRLEHLMKSVLAASRPVEYKMEPVDINLLLLRLLDRWHTRLLRVDIQHHLQVEAATPHVQGDGRALEQVFANLISNAMQAMSDGGGTLALKIRPIQVGQSTQVEVSITDTGPGIPDDIRDRLFEPFFTMSKTGTGLGLAIAKRIVTAHRGSIQVTSVPGGTVFQVRLPAAKPAEDL